MYAETVPIPPTADDTQTAGTGARLATALWRLATSSVLLLSVGAVTLALTLAALLLPQMPHNLQSNPAAATRWLMGAGADFGSSGAPLRTLGLFNLLHSPVFVLALALLAFLLMVQLARQIGVALALRHVRATFDLFPATTEALPLPAMLDLFRRRHSVLEPAATVAIAAERALTERWAKVERVTPGAPATSVEDEPEPGPELEEIRLMVVRHLPLAWLRPVMVSGLLLAVLSLWANSAFGWEVIPETLAPGANYRYPPRALELTYLLDEASEQLAAGLHTRLGATEVVVPIEPTSRHNVGRALLLTRAQAPGLVIRTEPPGLRVAQPGEPAHAGAVGFSFPEAGSEQSLLLPDASIGVRLVRLAPDDQAQNPYMVELYQASQASAVQRERVDVTKEIAIDVDGAEFDLKLTPAPAVDTLVRYQPLAWLGWLGVVLALLGLPGFLLHPAFVLAQITPLGDEQARVIVQSNRRSEVDAVAAGPTPPPPMAAAGEDA